MTSSQKVAFSLLVSVLAFCAFTVVAFSGLFDLLEVNFYQPVVQQIKEKKLEEISAAQNEYFDTLSHRFDSFTENSAVKTYIETHPSDSEAKNREKLRTELFTATDAISGIRIIDNNGRNVYFSTFSSDILSSKNGISYKNYDSLGELSFNSVKSRSDIGSTADANKKVRIIKDGDKNTIIFSLPFYDSKNLQKASILFYCDATSFSKFLFNRNLIDMNGFAALVTNSRSKNNEIDGFGGFVFGLPNYGKSSAKNQILENWKSGETFWKLAPQKNPENSDSQDTSNSENLDETTLCAFSKSPENDEYGFLTLLYSENELKFSPFMRILLLATAFLTFYLAIFLILSLKHDDIVIIKDKIHRYQNEFFIACKKNGQTDPKYLSEQKEIIERRVLKSLGKKGKKHPEEFKKLFDAHWQNLLTTQNQQGGYIGQINAEELKKIVRSSLEDILENGKVNLKIENLNSEIPSATPKGNEQIDSPKISTEIDASDKTEKITETNRPAPPTADIETSEIDKAEPLEETEVLENLDDVKELSEIEEIEEAEPLETADEPENLDEVEPLNEAEELDEVEEIEKVESLENADKPENLDEVEPLDDVEEVAEIEEIEESEPLENADKPKNLDEIESLEDGEEVAEIEEIEDAESLKNTDKPENLDEVKTLDDVEEAAEIEEIEDAESLKNTDEPENLEDVEELDEVEEIEETESLENADKPENLDEIEDLEEAEQIEELGEIEEIEPLEELSDAEKPNNEDSSKIAETLAALPDKAPNWLNNDEIELDANGLSRKLTDSERYYVDKLKEAASSINELDENLDELESLDLKEVLKKQSEVSADEIIPHLLDSNIEPDDDIYKDEVLLEKIEFGVPLSQVLSDDTNDSIADNFTASTPDYSFLDDDDLDDKMYAPEPLPPQNENPHFYKNEEIDTDEEQPSAKTPTEEAQPVEDVETIEKLDDSKIDELKNEEVPTSETELEEIDEVQPIEETSESEDIEEIEEINDTDDEHPSDETAIKETDDTAKDLLTLEEQAEESPFSLTKFGVVTKISELEEAK